MITLQAKVSFQSQEDEQEVLDLMRRWSSCMRFAYNRLLQGYDRKTLKRDLQKVFNLNSRYVDDAIMKGKSIIDSAVELGINPEKIVFGGRELFEKLHKHHINGREYERLKREWFEKRKGNLYSRGDRSKKGNLNTRIEIDENNSPFLRINVGERKYVYAKLSPGFKKYKNRTELLYEWTQSYIPYSIELKLKNGNIYAYISTEEEFPETEITRDCGVIGIDVNAYPDSLSYAEVDNSGNLVSYGTIPMQELSSGSKNKREYHRFQYAHKIVEIAKEKNKAIVIERLWMKDRGKRGDFSGRKLRRITHNFSYSSFLSKIKILSKRNGIEVIEVNPAYTSLIGMLKYAPQYMLTKDVASAYVIGRRGLGMKERVPKNYIKFVNSLTLDDLESLKEYIKKSVKNTYLKNKHLKEINRAVKLLQSLESEEERVSEPLDGTSFDTLNFFRVLKVAVVTPLSPEKVSRDFSTLKELLISGQVGRLSKALVPASWGRGYDTSKFRQSGMGVSEVADYKYPDLKLYKIV